MAPARSSIVELRRGLTTALLRSLRVRLARPAHRDLPVLPDRPALRAHLDRRAHPDRFQVQARHQVPVHSPVQVRHQVPVHCQVPVPEHPVQAPDLEHPVQAPDPDCPARQGRFLDPSRCGGPDGTVLGQARLVQGRGRLLVRLRLDRRVLSLQAHRDLLGLLALRGPFRRSAQWVRLDRLTPDTHL